MRLPYTANPPTDLAEEDKPILSRVQARRGERGLIPLDLALLHAPKIADGWNALLGAIRTKNSLPDDIREIAMCRVALYNRAWFEWEAHYPLLLASPGFTDAMGSVVKQLHPTERGALSEKQWAVLRYADAMTRSVEVGEEVFEAVRERFSEQEVVEVTATVAAYNMVSRFLVALDVGERNGTRKVEEL